tara:strand:- start:92 stop:253 length:162 start_codon:yes stop_codon:yes gene_type:complete
MIVLHEGIANAIIKEMEAPSASPRTFIENINTSLYPLLEPDPFATSNKSLMTT